MLTSGKVKTKHSLLVVWVSETRIFELHLEKQVSPRNQSSENPQVCVIKFIPLTFQRWKDQPDLPGLKSNQQLFAEAYVILRKLG